MHQRDKLFHGLTVYKNQGLCQYLVLGICSINIENRALSILYGAVGLAGITLIVYAVPEFTAHWKTAIPVVGSMLVTGSLLLIIYPAYVKFAIRLYGSRRWIGIPMIAIGLACLYAAFWG